MPLGRHPARSGSVRTIATRTAFAIGVCALCAVMLPSACASSENAPGRDHMDAGGAGGNAVPDAALAHGGGGAVGFAYDASSAGATSFGGQCSGTTSSGTPAPLDIYFIVDISGSMLEAVSTGVTKWDAVHQAISDFVNDPQSATLGVGIQYFPVTCSAHADCDSGGPCGITTCAGASSGAVDPCVSSASCPSREACYPLGMCSAGTGLCVPAGATNIRNCGNCVAAKLGTCWDNVTDCNTKHYSTPAVEIGVLSTNKQKILTSLGAVAPPDISAQYSTPTHAALDGAIAHAQAYAKSNPSHTVVTVLATDGYPNECVSAGVQTVNDAVQDVANVAAAGFKGSPSIRTYVIGVFPPTDTSAPVLLDTIARAGKTDHAYVANTDTNLAQSFRAALDQIRGRVFSCDYTLPPPPNGQSLDYGKVNVVFSAADSSTRLYFVKDAAGCDQVSAGGWYYDVDPASATPNKIILCPQNCTAFQGTAGGALDIELGCQTIQAPLH